ncbi:MAG TPA: response regulator [Chloroflexota bacterium]|nr:response regulator [Chloroflexota bacterium]
MPTVETAEVPAAGARRTAHVLLADDDEEVRSFVYDALTNEGYDVWLAADGRAALDLINARQPDLILLDVRMPVMDGPTFAAAYHRRPAPHAPIVLCTALPAVEAAEQAEAVGASGFLRKPFSIDALLVTVRQYVPLE